MPHSPLLTPNPVWPSQPPSGPTSPSPHLVLIPSDHPTPHLATALICPTPIWPQLRCGLTSELPIWPLLLSASTPIWPLLLSGHPWPYLASAPIWPQPYPHLASAPVWPQFLVFPSGSSFHLAPASMSLFLKKIWRTWVFFVGPLIPLFWTSG